MLISKAMIEMLDHFRILPETGLPDSWDGSVLARAAGNASAGAESRFVNPANSDSVGGATLAPP